MTFTFFLLQVASGVILVVAFAASQFSRRGLWRILMLLALAGVLIFGVLTYFPPLFGPFVPEQ